MSGLAAVVLAAGEGTRLRPLTALRPKPLCPVGTVPLLDLALRRVASVLPVRPGDVAVNAHHLSAQVVEHVGGRAHVSVEQPQALGTAGAIGRLAGWLAGRDVLVVNGDAYFAGDVDLPGFVAGWDRRRPRLLVVDDPARADFAGRWRFAGMSLLPGEVAAVLGDRPAGLYEQVWSRSRVELVPTDVVYVDCGTPADYLRANLVASGGAPVVDPAAVVRGSVQRAVVWPGAVVRADEWLVDCIRARDDSGADVTVPALPPPVRAVCAAAAGFGAGTPHIVAVALVGSWARLAGRADSDVDLVVLSVQPERLLADDGWFTAIGEGARLVGARDLGRLRERRLRLPGGLQVEVAIGAPQWAAADPPDEGTARVVRAGLRPVFDPHGLLGALAAAVPALGCAG